MVFMPQSPFQGAQTQLGIPGQPGQPGFPGQQWPQQQWPQQQWQGVPGAWPGSQGPQQWSGPQGPQGPQVGSPPPTAPPPQFIPQQPGASLNAVDPGAISGCLFRNTFVWLNNGEEFWFFPTFVGRVSAAGFRWNGRFWMYFGLDLRQIRTFTCF